VQICGVTNVEDAALAVRKGADLIGMIMWPKAKRSVDDNTAAAITACTFQSATIVCVLSG
jgi:phosphoribosylanthranilate isomerase